MRRGHSIDNVSSYTIWRNYIIGTIALSLVPIIASIVDKHWIISLVFLCFSLSLFTFVKLNRGCKYETCVLIPFIIARVFLVLTLLSIGFNVYLHRTDSDELGLFIYGHLSLLYPLIAALMILAHLKIKLNNKLCADCVARKGNPYERASMGITYYAEMNFLLKRIAYTYLILWLSSWGLWLISYYTGHLSNLTKAFCIYAPIAVFSVDGLLSGFLSYLAYRYNFIESMQSPELNTVNTKFIRITLLSDRAVYYSQKCGDAELDTPLTFSERYERGFSGVSVRNYLTKQLGADAYESLRLAYITKHPTNNCSIEHYMCFVKNESISNELEKKTGEIGVWLEISQLQEAFAQDILSKMACSELHRVFVVMQGYKKIQFENKQTENKDFTLSELKTTKADFSDSGWLLKSDIKDGNFFKHLARLWHRYIEGFN